MKILAIETSCDDTGIAVLDVKKGKNPVFSALSNVVASQIKVHQKYGGVFPAMAKREHQKNLLPTFETALKEAKLLQKLSGVKILAKKPAGEQNTKYRILNTILKREPELLKQIIPFLKKYQKPDVDIIAATNGPGLEPCLWVGVNFAKALSFFWDIPLVAINHIEAHILVNYLGNKNIKTPAIALIVSGGHTQIVLMEKLGKYQILGETRDDAAGECFDKCAKILGLSYPGGPAIAAEAEKFQISNFKFQINLPRPMINTKDYDMSFSGLKTAVLYADKEQKIKNEEYKQAMANEIQQAIIDVLIKKTMKALNDFSAKTIILGGGVSANKELRNQFQSKAKENKIDLIAPPENLSTDNGLMIAVAAYFRKNKKNSWQKLEANANLRLE